MRPIGKALAMVLASCAAWPLCGQTLPSAERLGADGRGAVDGNDPDFRGEFRENGTIPFNRQEPVWPAYPQQPAERPGGGGVLQAGYLAEVPETGPPPDGGPAGAAAGGAGTADWRSVSGSGLLLPPRGSHDGSATTSATGGLPSVLGVGSSLAVVVGLFLLLAWALRRAAPGESALLPAEVVEVLGRKVVGQRQQLQLLRLGGKLLLIVVTPDGAETLTEITDPLEVERLSGLCRQAQPGSATVAFRQVLRQFGGDRTEDRHA